MDASASAVPFLPNEIYMEILSWLPAYYLGRCKCVCKQWYDMIETRSFAIKHFSRSAPVSIYCEDEGREESVAVDDGTIVQEKFRIIRVFATGLVSEKGNLSGKYRLRNLTTQEIVYLPDPHRDTFMIVSNHGFSSSGIKLVSVYGYINRTSCWIQGFEFLNLDRDDQWSPLEFPIFPEHGIGFQANGNIVYCVNPAPSGDGSKLRIDVHSFDMERECFFRNTLPRGSFPDSCNAPFLNWNGCIAFGEMVEENLNVLVLEDHRMNKWGEKKMVVPLTFLKEKPSLKGLRPTSFDLGKLWFLSGNRWSHIYHTQSQKLIRIKPVGDRHVKRYTLRPSVITFKRKRTAIRQGI